MKYFHTALAVFNLQESQKFYEDVFGFKLKSKGERLEKGVKFIYLEDHSGSVIELFEQNNPVPLSENLMDYSHVGFKHIAFIVENIEDAIKKAVKSGAKIISQPAVGVMVKRKAFIRDPNGLAIELVEI